MTLPATSISGTSNPTLLPHPGFGELDWRMRGVFSYVIRHPGEPGPAMVIRRNDGDVYTQVGGWDGRVVVPGDETDPLCRHVELMLESKFVPLLTLMSFARFQQAEFYFSDDLTLVDVQLSLNKFVGPGMLNDVFGKTVKTVEVLGTSVLDDAAMSEVLAGNGMYSGDLLLKPSRYREVELADGRCVPLYAQVRR